MTEKTSVGVPFEFGKFVKVNKNLSVVNTMRFRTCPGIYLGITKNLQGTNKVFGLKTGVAKKPKIVTPYLVPDYVI